MYKYLYAFTCDNERPRAISTRGSFRGRRHSRRRLVGHDSRTCYITDDEATTTGRIVINVYGSSPSLRRTISPRTVNKRFAIFQGKYVYVPSAVVCAYGVRRVSNGRGNIMYTCETRRTKLGVKPSVFFFRHSFFFFVFCAVRYRRTLYYCTAKRKLCCRNTLRGRFVRIISTALFPL